MPTSKDICDARKHPWDAGARSRIELVFAQIGKTFSRGGSNQLGKSCRVDVLDGRRKREKFSLSMLFLFTSGIAKLVTFSDTGILTRFFFLLMKTNEQEFPDAFVNLFLKAAVGHGNLLIAIFNVKYQ